jgi:hypothetical protein
MNNAGTPSGCLTWIELSPIVLLVNPTQRNATQFHAATALDTVVDIRDDLEPLSLIAHAAND